MNVLFLAQQAKPTRRRRIPRDRCDPLALSDTDLMKHQSNYFRYKHCNASSHSVFGNSSPNYSVNYSNLYDSELLDHSLSVKQPFGISRSSISRIITCVTTLSTT